VTARLHGQRRTASHRAGRGCPTCGLVPTVQAEVVEQRLDLQVVWLAAHPAHPAQLTARRFCAECQPRGVVYAIACRACGDGPMLTGDLAEAAVGGDLLPVVTAALAARGWRPARDRSGWVCCQ
jgi:hypothetical protein